MAQQFVKGDNNKKGVAMILDMQVNFLEWGVLNRLRSWLSIGVAQVNIFEAEVFSDIVVVWNINPNRNS